MNSLLKNTRKLGITALVGSLALSLVLSGCGSSTPADNKDAKANNKAAGAVHVYTRDSASGTREGFEKVVGFAGKLTDKANEVASNGEMAKQVGNDPDGIGYVSLETNFKDNHLKPLKFEGVEPTAENTIDGKYKMARPFCFTTRAKGDYESPEKEQLVEAFLAFILKSTEGKEVIKAAGGIVDMKDAKPWDELKSQFPVLEKDNSKIEIVTGGSTSVEKAIKAALESFQGYAGGVKFRMAQTGSAAGWERTLGPEKDGPNRSDIGFASRKFKDKEPTDKAIASGSFCQDAIVAVVNEANKSIDNATKEDLYALFTGAITEWSQLKK